MQPKEAVVVDSVRTGLTKSFRGGFNQTRPDDMVAHLIDALLDRNESLTPDCVEDVLLGCGFPEAYQGNVMGRSCVTLTRLPITVGGATVNRYCSSGLQTIATAAAHIQSGYADCIIAGGVESISLLQPIINLKGVVNPKIQTRYPGIYHTMIQTAETVAKRYGISREDQDAYALQSQLRVAKAQQQGLFKDEIIPMHTVMQVKDKLSNSVTESSILVDRDSCNRPDSSLEGLSALRPVLGPGKCITAGNAAQLSDGASLTLVMSRKKAAELGLRPKLIVKGFVTVGCEPSEMGIGPVAAVVKLLKKHGINQSEIDLWELNEAFASQVLAVCQQLKLPMQKLNVNGGSIAVGHPYGMTGSRQVGHVMGELERRQGRYAVVTMCVGGGQGAAALFERVA